MDSSWPIPIRTTSVGRRWTCLGPCTWSDLLPAIPEITRVSSTETGRKKCCWPFGSLRYSRPRRIPDIFIICTMCSPCILSYFALLFITLFSTAVGFWKSPTTMFWRPKSPPFTWGKESEFVKLVLSKSSLKTSKFKLDQN